MQAKLKQDLLRLKRKIFNNTIVITSQAEIEPYAFEKRGNEYIKYISEKIAFGITREYSKYLAEYIKNNILIDDVNYKPFNKIKIDLKAQRLNEESVTIENVRWI